MMPLSDIKSNSYSVEAKQYVPGIQALRAIAAFLIVIVHTPGAFISAGANPFQDLWPLQVGVDIFFVISGFVMVHSSRRGRHKNPIIFMKERIIRIIPLYWIFTTIAVLFMLFKRYPDVVHLSEVRTIVASFMFWPHASNPNQQWSVPVYSVGWTLNYEMFFYALFAISLLFKHETTRSLLIILTLWFCALLGCIANLRTPFVLWFNPLIVEFSLGMIVALLFNTGFGLQKTWCISGIFISIGVFSLGSWFRDAVIDFLSSFSEFWRPLLWGIPSALLVFSVISLDICYSSRLGKFIIFSGSASYAIYLSHPVVLDEIARLFVHGENSYTLGKYPIFVEVFSIIVALMLSFVVYWIVERPIYEFIRKIGRARQVMVRFS